MTLEELFKADADHPMRTCGTCKHRQRWECNSKVFQYCAVRRSKRTSNGHLKIKCKQPACGMYQEDKK